jgi:hypothetical protein
MAGGCAPGALRKSDKKLINVCIAARFSYDIFANINANDTLHRLLFGAGLRKPRTVNRKTPGEFLYLRKIATSVFILRKPLTACSSR